MLNKYALITACILFTSTLSTFTLAAGQAHSLTPIKNTCTEKLNHPTTSKVELDNCDFKDSDMWNIVDQINAHDYIDMIDLQNNKITDVGMTIFANNIKVNVKHLYLSGNSITDNSVAKLTRFKNLVSLYLSKTRITQKSIHFLTQFPALERLSIDGNHLGDDAAQALSKLPNLFLLRVANNEFTDRGVAYLDQLTRLNSLDIENNKITDAGVISIAKHHPNLAFLRLRGNQVTAVGAEAMSHLIRLFLVALDSDIGDEGVLSLLKLARLKYLLLENTRIHSIDTLKQLSAFRGTRLKLENGGIADAGAVELARNTYLNYLQLNNNYIGDAGASALARMKNMWLVALANNHVGDAGAISLSQLVDDRFSTAIDLSGNPISDKAIIALADGPVAGRNTFSLILNNLHVGRRGLEALGNSKRITFLYLENNNLSDADVGILARNHTVEGLFLNHNNIGDAGVEALISYPRDYPDLRHLQLGYNNITDKGAFALANSPTKIEYLDISYNHLSQAGINAVKASSNFYQVELEGNELWLSKAG